MENDGIYDPKLDLARYYYPTLDLLDNSAADLPVTAEELDRNTGSPSVNPGKKNCSKPSVTLD
jgi:hypothetical protein